QTECAIQLEVRKAAHVKEVQRIRCIIGTGDVGIGPRGGFLQIEERVGMRQSSGKTTTGKREVEFCCSEFQVIAPFIFRIEAEGGDCEQAAGRSICQIENMLG